MSSNIKKHYAVIVGARPNFVKAAPFFREAKNHPELKFTVIHTGQHFDANMSDIFFSQMGLPRPDIHLDIKGEFHTEKIGKMFNALQRVFKAYNFDGTIVFGDVNSTLAGALAAVKSNSHLIHIESGLRSHDRRMPEEINRVIIDHISEKLFTTEPAANENLAREDIAPEKIFYVGNIMIEALEVFWPQIEASEILKKLELTEKNYVVATIHRQENTDDEMTLKNILNILQTISKKWPMVMPLHPGTKAKINSYGLNDLLNGIKIVEPLGYFDFLKLVSSSQGVITDSGGIQEETSHLGISCVTLRDNTERPITITMGSNKLFNIDTNLSPEMLEHLAKKDWSSRHIPLWDQEVSKRIFSQL